MKELGTDIYLEEGDIVPDETGDIRIVSGEECLRANLMDRLVIEKGELPLHPSFGIGLERYVSGMDVEKIKDEVLFGFLEDPRVKECVVDVRIEGRTVYIETKIEYGDSDMNFVFPLRRE